MNIGDVLFFYDSIDEEAQEIKKVDCGYNGISFYHCAIYIGNNRIVEAVEPLVAETTLDKYSEHPYLVCSTANDILGLKASEVAKSLIGYPYNKLYLDEVKSFYCSSLIHYAYQVANDNKNYFKKHELKFRDASGIISEYWNSLYGENSMEVPERMLGSNPSNLSTDEKFVSRYFVGK